MKGNILPKAMKAKAIAVKDVVETVGMEKDEEMVRTVVAHLALKTGTFPGELRSLGQSALRITWDPLD